MSTIDTRPLRLDALPLPLAEGNAPPARFRLFAFGENRTTYGPIYLTEESARAAVAAAAALGRDLLIDWHHTSERSPRTSEEGAAAGWFGLEVDAAGLWASVPQVLARSVKDLDRVFWTPKADAQIRALEFRHYSPTALIAEDEQGRLLCVGIASCALTNTPATLEQTPLTLSEETMSKAATPTPTPAPTNTPGPVDPAAAASVFQLAAELTKETDPSKIRGALRALAERPTEAPQAPTDDARAARVTLALADFRDRYDEAERPALEKIGLADVEELRAYLAARPRRALAAHTNPTTPRPTQPQPAAALTWNGKGWAQMSGTEKHALSQENPALYDAMMPPAVRRFLVEE